MHSVAQWSDSERRDLFRETSAVMGLHPAIVEKDFWVCWVLDYLFGESPWCLGILFKGGTSLSKVFGVIDRFSEDIDLVLDWRLLGYEAFEPLAARSATQQDRLGKEILRQAFAFLSETVAPVLGEQLALRLGAPIAVNAKDDVVTVRYPRAFSIDAILPEIRLEIGPMAAWLPNIEREISPYASVYFPDAFQRASTGVRVVAAERTFWEKATILHMEAHRSAEKKLPARYSRHYYDLYRLATCPIGDLALERLDLLADVVDFKKRFYRSTWANYDAACPGSLRLVPASQHRAAVHTDYRAMRAMLYGRIPDFDEIEAVLKKLERTINGG